jgi:hypothetical protein
MENRIFKCDICNIEFKSKQNLTQHLNKKNKCNMITDFQCKRCLKYFKYKKNLIEHEDNNKCKQVNTSIIKSTNENDLKMTIRACLMNSIKQEDKAKLLNVYNQNISTDKIELLINSDVDLDSKVMMIYTLLNKDQNNNTNINNGTINTSNNNTTITNNIQINSFGKEDTSYLDNEYFKNLILDNHIENSYMKLMNDIYLNKEHPENRTVKVDNINNKYALVFNNGKWESILKYELKELLHQKNHTMLKMHYNKLKDLMSTGKKDEIRVFLTRDDTSDPHMMYMIDRVILLFYNGKELYEVGKLDNDV